MTTTATALAQAQSTNPTASAKAAVPISPGTQQLTVSTGRPAAPFRFRRAGGLAAPNRTARSEERPDPAGWPRLHRQEDIASLPYSLGRLGFDLVLDSDLCSVCE